MFLRPPPQLPDIILSEQGFKKVSLVFQEELNLFLSFLHEIAIGKNLKLFLLVCTTHHIYNNNIIL